MGTLLDSYPFLSEIPEKVISEIDLDALYIPTPSEQKLLTRLSWKLERNVVIYKNNYVCKGTHLCRTLRPARLTSAQLEFLNLVEKDFSERQIVVAYEKPLVLVDF